MPIEIGASSLSPEQVFDVLYLGAQLKVDNSYAYRQAKDFDVSVLYFSASSERDFSLLVLILYLANSTDKISVAGLELLIERFEASFKLEANKVFSYPAFAALQAAVPLRIADKVSSFALALYAELSCADFGFLNAATAPSCRTLSEEIRAYTANTKKVNFKVPGDDEMFRNALLMRDVAHSLSPKAREQLRGDQAQLYLPVGEWIAYSAGDIARRCLEDSYRRLAFYQHMRIEGGMWKAPARSGGIYKDAARSGAADEPVAAKVSEPVVVKSSDPAELYTPDPAGFKTPEPADLYTLKPANLYSPEHVLEDLLVSYAQEIQKAASLLRTAKAALTKGKLPVGMGVAQFLELSDSADVSDRFKALQYLKSAVLPLLAQILSSSTARRVPFPPAGTRDLTPAQTFARKSALAAIRDVFEKHSAVEIDTPTFESRAVLLGKYGEDQKLIYNIEDFGEEPLALRYDLTVPFARFCASNGVKEIKRYQIGRVYRRDKPVIEKGRFREFYQCDFDIAGEFALMAADAEVLCVVFEILYKLKLDFTIYVNDRRLLDAILGSAGVPPEKFRAVCSCIDALDKISLAECRDKIIGQKGIDASVCDSVLSQIGLSAPAAEFPALLESISGGDQRLFEAAKLPLENLQLLLNHLGAMYPQALQRVKVDFSLARGLDYYTGMVFEAKINRQASSIAGGGRYDGLLGQTGGQHTSAVGGSVGIERIFALFEQKSTQEKALDCYVAACPGGSLEDRLHTAGMLWEKGIKAGVSIKDNYSLKALKRDLEDAVSSGCKFCLLRGGDEIGKNVIAVKDLEKQTQVEIPLEQVVDFVTTQLGESIERFSREFIKKKLQEASDGVCSIEDVLKLME